MVKFNYKGTKYQISVVQRFSTDIFINVLFLGGHKNYYYVAKDSHEQFMIMYFNILTFVILTFFFLNNNQMEVFHTKLSELPEKNSIVTLKSLNNGLHCVGQ